MGEPNCRLAPCSCLQGAWDQVAIPALYKVRQGKVRQVILDVVSFGNCELLF